MNACASSETQVVCEYANMDAVSNSKYIVHNRKVRMLYGKLAGAHGSRSRITYTSILIAM